MEFPDVEKLKRENENLRRSLELLMLVTKNIVSTS